MTDPMRRRAALPALAALLAAAGCSVLPDRPYQESLRFALSPQRPARQAAPRGAPVLQLRLMRAAPGLDQRGLRLAGADGVVAVEFWSEWTAPPAELAEEALRQWMAASGLFAAVVAPGSRLNAEMVMEGELTRLQAEPVAGIARAGLSVLLLSETERDAAGQRRILGSFLAEGTAPLPGGARAPGARLPAAEAAQAMQAALADALGRLEAEVRAALAPRGAAGAARRR